MGTEVVYAQEETNTTGVLVPNDGSLALTICAGQEQAGLGARRSYDNPPLRLTVSGHGGGVFDKLELQDIDKESDRRIVVTNDDRYELKKGH